MNKANSGPQSVVQPAAQGNYVLATREDQLIYTAGMTPRRAGKLILSGPVTTGPLDSYQEAVELSCANAVAAAQGALKEGEHLGKVLSMTVYIATDASFSAHSQLADYASNYLFRTLGEAGRCSRIAIGVYTLPGNAPVEISLVAVARKD